MNIGKLIASAIGETREKRTTAYGTVAAGGVVIDGSGVVTPCANAMASKPGDRVVVSIEDHRATITGNITAPATDDAEAKEAAKTATSFMNLREDGLVVGKLDDNGDPMGGYTRVDNDSFDIVTDKGTASFEGGSLNLIPKRRGLVAAGSDVNLGDLGGISADSMFGEENVLQLWVGTKDGGVTPMEARFDVIGTREVEIDFSAARMSVNHGAPFVINDVAIPNQTIAAHGYWSGSVDVPQIDGYRAVAIVGQLIYNVSSRICWSRCKLQNDGTTATICLVNASTSSFTMTETSTITVMYVSKAMLDL